MAFPTTLKPAETTAEPVPARIGLWLSVRQYVRQRRGLLSVVRALSSWWWLGPWRAWWVRHYQKQRRNPRLPRQTASLFHHLDVSASVARLARLGVASGLQLPELEINHILSFCAAEQRDTYANPHTRCYAIKQIAYDPKLLAVVSAHLGAEPILYSSHLYWTWPPANEAKRQELLAQKSRFHYDVGDFKSLSVFFYLTDVDENCGPHVVIEGTQNHKSFWQLMTRYLPDGEARRNFGDQIRVLTGARGTGFFEELTCYHKHSAGTKPRLMLTITYLLQRAPLPGH